jgi:uncharacterized protein (TIGR02217 family)
MADIFDDVRLPEDIERGALGGPTFDTTVIILASGKEQRNQEWELVRGSYNIGYGIQKREDMEAVYAFFHARRGRARGFRFRDWLDFKVTAQPVGTVVGDPLQRQLVRLYDDPINPYLRIITHPVASTLKVYVNSVLTTAYTLEDGGRLVFLSDPGVDVVASFEFDIPVRFDVDALNVMLNTYQEGTIPSIQIVELV